MYMYGVDNLWTVKRLLVFFQLFLSAIRHGSETMKCRTGIKADAMMADTDTNMLANDRSGARGMRCGVRNLTLSCPSAKSQPDYTIYVLHTAMDH